MLVKRYSALGAGLLLVFISTASSQTTTTLTTAKSCDEPPRRCEAYCDVSGDPIDSFECPDSGNKREIFCCGSEYERFCCANKSEDVTCEFPEKLICPNSWWIFNWQMALAMLGSVVLLLTVSACCCQCFSHKTNQRAFARTGAEPSRRRRRANADVATIEMEETPAREQIFDPNSIHAFQPPDYAKDPPKYQDIDFAGTSTGEENPAFTSDEGINPASGGDILPPPDDTDTENRCEVTPPPPYTLYETVDDSEVDIALNANSNSSSSSPRIIRVSSSPTIVDNTDDNYEENSGRNRSV